MRKVTFGFCRVKDRGHGLPAYLLPVMAIAYVYDHKSEDIVGEVQTFYYYVKETFYYHVN